MRFWGWQRGTQLLKVALLTALLVVHASDTAAGHLSAAMSEVDMEIAAAVDALAASAISDLDMGVDALATVALFSDGLAGTMASPIGYFIYSADIVWAFNGEIR